MTAKKRSGYLEWDEYFMGVAFLAAQRSKDPSTQVGACIVNSELKIVGVGYNGFPIGCSDDSLPWSKSASDRLGTKYPYVCHAELNAIVNKNSSDVRGCVMYVTLFPCNECAKLAIQAGISKIVYLSDKHHSKPEMVASRTLFDMVGILYERFIPKRTQIVIDYESGMREEMERSILVERRQSRDEQRLDRDEERQDRDEFVRQASTLKGEVKSENNNVIADKGEVEIDKVSEGEEEEEEELAPILDGLDQSNVSSPSVSPVPDRQSPLPDLQSPSCASGNEEKIGENCSNTKGTSNRSSSTLSGKNCDNNVDKSNLKDLRLSSSEICLLHARILAQLQLAAAMGRKRGLTLNDIVAQVLGMEEEEKGEEAEVETKKKRVKMDEMIGIAAGDGMRADGQSEEILLRQNAEFVDAKAAILKSVELLRNEGLVALGDGGNYTFVGGKQLQLGGRGAATAKERLTLDRVGNEEDLCLGEEEEELSCGGEGGGAETKSSIRSSTPRKRLT